MSVRVAIVGAGPAGAYAAGELLRRGRGVEVDIFERLPTPWGLLRAGVAPDHQEIKILARHFEQDVAHPGCRFFGNVEIGRDIAHDELMRHYAAVVYASGAQAGRELGVPGEDLPGSLAATEFVGWYNGHPDHRGLAPDLSCARAVVIGNGNVAADVARILLRDPSELEATDIADHALDALRFSRVREVVVIGRRGPAQAAFTNAELHELGTIGGVDVVVDPAEAEPGALSQDWLESEASFTARRNVELIRGFAARRPAGASRRLVLRFLRAPVAIRGRERVEGVELCRTELLRDDHGALQARPTEDGEALGCGLVLRSVGYRAVPLPGVPFDERRSVLPNERGRVAPGVYAVGWIKRGPTGILGTNKRDAEQTVRTLLDDLVAGRMPAPEAPGAAAAAALVARAKPDHVSFAGWRRIDDHEVARGRATGRPRVKRCEIGSLLEAAGATPA